MVEREPSKIQIDTTLTKDINHRENELRIKEQSVRLETNLV